MPDRNAMGRPIKRVCGPCHKARLEDDIDRIIIRHYKKNAGTEDIVGVREGSKEL